MGDGRQIGIRLGGALLAVVAGVWVGTAMGDTEASKAVATAVGAVVVATLEGLVVVLPRWSPRARALLDPRAAALGVWVQGVDRRDVGGVPDVSGHNAFGVVHVSSTRNGTYGVEGRAYDTTGGRHSEFRSAGPLSFSFDGPGTTYTYLYSGSQFSRPEARTVPDPVEPRSTGVVTVSLTGKDSGRGRVDHVAQPVVLEFDLQRVTPPWLREHGMGDLRPASLVELPARDRFARRYAEHRAARPACCTGGVGHVGGAADAGAAGDRPSVGTSGGPAGGTVSGSRGTSSGP